MTGIEPAPSVWKTEALPLSYIPAEPSQEGAEAGTFFRWNPVPVTTRA